MADPNKDIDAAAAAANNAAQKATGSTSVSTFSGGSIASPITANRAVLAGLNLGDKYNIQYDQNYIRDLLDTATQAEYNRKRQEFAATENKFYNELYDTQDAALNAIRASNSAAVATGATKGMAAAQQLAAILGLEQTSVESATDLANQRNELMAQEAAAYAKNANTALDTSNALKQAIAEAALTKYGYDTQSYVGELDYNAALQAVIGEIIQSQNAAAATMYNADRNLEGTKYAANANRYGGGYGAGGGYDTGDGYKPGSGNSFGSMLASSMTSLADKIKQGASDAMSLVPDWAKNIDGNYKHTGVGPGYKKMIQDLLGDFADGKWGSKAQETTAAMLGVSSPAIAYLLLQNQIADAINNVPDNATDGTKRGVVRKKTKKTESDTATSGTRRNTQYR